MSMYTRAKETSPLISPPSGARPYPNRHHSHPRPLRWGCSPKGAALLWAAPERQVAVLPNVTSHGYGLVRCSLAGLNVASPVVAVSLTISHSAQEQVLYATAGSLRDAAGAQQRAVKRFVL